MPQVKTVMFRNFSDQVFSAVVPHKAKVGDSMRMIVDENCKWDGEPYTFQPGETRYMSDWKARHFAKHLVNRELVKRGMDNDTSPKKPEDNPRYMELFNKAFIEDPKAAAMSEDMAEDEAMSKNKDLEIEKLKAENARLKAQQNGDAAVVEESEPHTITQEDLDANPGLEEDVKVGDEVLLPKAVSEDSDLVTPIEEDDEDEDAPAPAGSEEAGFAGLKPTE